MKNILAELYIKYTGSVSRDEQRALDRNGQVISLGTNKPIILEPDPYTGEFHDHTKDDGRAVRVIWDNGVYQSFVVVSQDILDASPELLQPGFHSRPILLDDKELKNVKINIALYKKGDGDIPSIAIQSMGCPVEALNMFNGDGKPVNFGDATVNTHSLAIGVRTDQPTTFKFQGYSLDLKGVNPKRIEVKLSKTT